MTEFELVTAGQEESQTYERKGAFLWNQLSQSRDKKIRLGCLKTIAGFLNTGGGLLEIGVGDRGELAGLEAELTALFSEDHLDQYQQLIEEAIVKTLFPLPLGHCAVSFENRQGNWVCQITVQAKEGVTYLREQNQAGDQVFSIYVRTGNRTVALQDIQRDEFVVQRLSGSAASSRPLFPLSG
jgi:predicted HTH transcriptional regulator